MSLSYVIVAGIIMPTFANGNTAKNRIDTKEPWQLQLRITWLVLKLAKVCRPETTPECSTFWVILSEVGSWPYLQTLDRAGKPFHGQTL